MILIIKFLGEAILASVIGALSVHATMGKIQL